MFEDDYFFTWPGVLVGASCLALLCGIAVSMGGLVAGGMIGPPRRVAVFAAAAFAGYLCVAAILRRPGKSSDGR